jgi:Phage integrase, N-terminal SAM-like domain
MTTAGIEVDITRVDPLDRIRAIVLNSVHSAHSRRAYTAALDSFFGWYQDMGAGQPISKALVQEWVAYQRDNLELAPATVNQRLSAVKKLATEAADNHLLDPEAAQAVLRVKGIKRTGVRIGNWLTIDQAERLLQDGAS